MATKSLVMALRQLVSDEGETTTRRNASGLKKKICRSAELAWRSKSFPDQSEYSIGYSVIDICASGSSASLRYLVVCLLESALGVSARARLGSTFLNGPRAARITHDFLIGVKLTLSG